ncbi:hypothetical protein SmJEL517_g05329 [Synchytrium microbalum]|uniref:Mevalonate kinase n=1 Tax=Synchytrium microbalum TaxID=1806994 RepID=A0A507BPL4_9FUNG|nr:uncharacterized protein SmJEL517_g05329 [Synchytrium microbalum]TPX31287.1 hypothetical protein SmJEL517_g05329 [Synchytrium microbalum]
MDNEQSYFVATPGKVILFGEHAVVYGKTALASALGLRTYAWLKTRHDGLAVLHFPDVGLTKSWNIQDVVAKLAVDPIPGKPIPMSSTVGASLGSLLSDVTSGNSRQAALAFLYMLARIHPQCSGVEVIVRSALPIGAGLGSSASYSVCAAAGLLLAAHAIQPIQPPSTSFAHDELISINEWAFISEKILHGTPSGIDNSLCTFGGAQLFAKGDLQPLKGFTSLRFLLINTCVPRDTKKQVENVRKRKEQLPAIMHPLMDAVQGVTESCKEAFAQIPIHRPTIISTMETLIDINHGLMVAAGVSHPSLETVRRITSQHGLVSKLTGGGGGGCAIALIRDDTSDETIHQIATELQAQGMESFETTVGGSGVQGMMVTEDLIRNACGCGYETFDTGAITWSKLDALLPK